MASFAIRGAAPGILLAKLVLESVFQLERNDAYIMAVGYDDAGNNRSMWTHLGISGKCNGAKNEIPHSSLRGGRSLHIMCDIAHIMKCIRNNLLTHNYAMVSVFPF